MTKPNEEYEARAFASAINLHLFRHAVRPVADTREGKLLERLKQVERSGSDLVSINTVRAWLEPDVLVLPKRPRGGPSRERLRGRREMLETVARAAARKGLSGPVLDELLNEARRMF